MADHDSFRFVRQYKRFILFCIAFMLGLLAGVLFITQYPFYSLMRLLSYPQMSIVVGFFVSATPFLVFYIVVRCSVNFLIMPLAFLKALCFMYCFGGISFVYTDAGWLVRFLLLFTDCFSVPLLIWYVGRILRKNQKSLNRGTGFCLVVLLVIRWIDYSVISPFVSELLSF